jgi:Mg2+ and Co2+ transporter CorA
LSKPGCLYPSPANVAHTVFDAVVDEYLPIMNRLSAMVGGIEDELLAAGDASDAILDYLFHLKHELSALRRLAVPSRDIVSILIRIRRLHSTVAPHHGRTLKGARSVRAARSQTLKERIVWASAKTSS